MSTTKATFCLLKKLQINGKLTRRRGTERLCQMARAAEKEMLKMRKRTENH